MSEQLDLTTPVPATVTTYFIRSFLTAEWQKPTPVITVGVIDSQGVPLDFTYIGTEAKNRLSQLNTANLTTRSLEKRILDMLVADGKLPAGTVSGVPR